MSEDLPRDTAENCAEMLVYLKRAVPASQWVPDLIEAVQARESEISTEAFF